MSSEHTDLGAAAPERDLISAEQTATLPGGVDICFQTVGSPADPPLLLVMGLGGPMTWWPIQLCLRLAAEGFHVIRYDNRDTGRSTRFDEHPVAFRHLLQAAVRRKVPVSYTMKDMAEDGVGLLDHLGIDKAHVAGVSMGGMIAQTIAVEHPDRVLSLTSIMSSTGRRFTGYQHPLLLPYLARRSDRTRERYVESSVAFWRRISSPGYPTADEVFRTRAGETWDRGVSLHGVSRQIVAILTQPDRTLALGRLTMPVTVVHGLTDRLVHVSGGRATARAIPGAELMLVPGMGHDLPEGLYDTIVEAVTRSARRSSRARG